jgi:hypothetical protein
MRGVATLVIIAASALMSVATATFVTVLPANTKWLLIEEISIYTAV